MNMKTTWRARRLIAAVLMPLGLLAAGVGAAGASISHAGVPSDLNAVFTVHVILSGSTLSHSYTPAGGAPSTEPLTDPDDITPSVTTSSSASRTASAHRSGES